MADFRFYTLPQLLDRLGFCYHYDHNHGRGKMDCFRCGKKRGINLDFYKNRYRCPACGESGGVMHLFAIFQLGIPREAFPTNDKEAKEKIRIALCEYMDGSDAAHKPKSGTSYSPPKEIPTVPVADDDTLNAAYSAMQNIPALQLTDIHRQELKKRGLTDDVISQNGYLSIPEDLPASEHYWKIYEYEGGEQRRKKLSWITDRQIIFGLMIADYLIAKGLTLQGVPGFFKFGVHWCFWSIPGILIPTRNIKGQIVIWQVRRDKLVRKGDAKYITVASKKLPGHVTADDISRCHFPLRNAPLSANMPVLITEGPLKADVACFLYGGPVTFAAIPGIQTTKDLLSYARTFKKAGIRTIYNALDMDRITNNNVRKGSVRLVAAFRKKGIAVKNMYWGEDFAVSRFMECSMIAKLRKVPVKYPGVFPGIQLSVFDKLDAVTNALATAKINPFHYKNAAGETVSLYWDPKTKGIDDYLFNR